MPNKTITAQVEVPESEWCEYEGMNQCSKLAVGDNFCNQFEGYLDRDPNVEEDDFKKCQPCLDACEREKVSHKCETCGGSGFRYEQCTMRKIPCSKCQPTERS